jgi:molybdopterin/thiamine biosynthesis adenylyltransferase
MNLYNRQEKLKLDTNQSITVVGCGGIGFWVCKFLAMSGVETIYAFDDDRIEEHNLNRLDIPESFIGANKADVVKRMVEMLRPECNIKTFPFKFSDVHRTGTKWLVDCTDNSKSQEANQKIADEHGMRYFKAGYDGENMSLHNRVAEWGEAQDGYVVIPSWVVPASMIAAMAVAKILKYPENEMITNVEGIFEARRK